MPGAGKSLFLLSWMEEKARAGRRVWTNLRLSKSCPFASQVFQMDDPENHFPVFDAPREKPCPVCGRLARPAKNCPSCFGNGPTYSPFRAWWHWSRPGDCFAIDELDNYMDSSDFGEIRQLGAECALYPKMHRKLGHDVCYTIQRKENLWVRFRRQTQEWILCESDWRVMPGFVVRWVPDYFLRFKRWRYYDENCSHLVDTGNWTRKEASRMFAWYDTKQVLGPANLTDWCRNEYTVSSDGSAAFARRFSERGGAGGPDASAAGSVRDHVPGSGNVDLPDVVGLRVGQVNVNGDSSSDVDEDAGECVNAEGDGEQ